MPGPPDGWATGPSRDEQEATVVGADKFVGGYGTAKIAHDHATLAGGGLLPDPRAVLAGPTFSRGVARIGN